MRRTTASRGLLQRLQHSLFLPTLPVPIPCERPGSAGAGGYTGWRQPSSHKEVPHGRSTGCERGLVLRRSHVEGARRQGWRMLPAEGQADLRSTARRATEGSGTTGPGNERPVATRSASRSLSDHFPRRFVPPQPQEPRMAKLPARCPFGEPDLADENRPDPMHSLAR